MDKYCKNCARMVGTKKQGSGAGIAMLIIGVVLFLFIPVVGWFVGAPLALVGLVTMLCGGKTVCAVCGSQALEDAPLQTGAESPTA